MDGPTEVDEAYIGGDPKNMHARRRVLRPYRDKSAVLGILQRSRGENPSRVQVRCIPIASKVRLHSAIRETVEAGTTVYTDKWGSYRGLTGYVHHVINHAAEYVNGHIHTNGIENFWSLLKRSLRGTYISVEPFHLERYVDEQVFRFNERKGSDADRFRAALRRIFGKRLTYRELTIGTVASAA